LLAAEFIELGVNNWPKKRHMAVVFYRTSSHSTGCCICLSPWA
jgi:hypothetical protein